MTQLFTNAARSPLMASIIAGDTSITVDAALADLFPVADTGTDPVGTVGKDWFKVVLQDSSANLEIIYVRTRGLGSATLSNCQRGQEGTTARAYTAGDIVGLRLTALDYENALELSALATVAGKAMLNAASAAAQRALLATTRSDVASVAGTVDLSAVASDDIRITGALTITGFTIAAGRVARVTAGGAFTLTNNSAIVTNTGSNVVLASGDSFILRATAADTVEVLFLSRATTGVMIVQDQKTSGTAGGASSTGTNTRVLNTTVKNTISGASLGSNQITLPAGEYEIEAFAPCYAGNEHKLSLRNITDSTNDIIGNQLLANSATAVENTGTLVGSITITGTKVFELRHYIGTARATNGLGNFAGTGVVEVYASVKIKKVA